MYYCPVILIPNNVSPLNAPPCDDSTRYRLTAWGTNYFMTYPKEGGDVEMNTLTPAGSGSLFCRSWMDGSDGMERGVVYVAVESDTGNKVLRHNSIENAPVCVCEYLKLSGERFLSRAPIGQPGYFYLEPRNAIGKVLKYDTNSDEVILVPIDNTDPKIRWNQFTV